jgi:hypothetical protein
MDLRINCYQLVQQACSKANHDVIQSC